MAASNTAFKLENGLYVVGNTYVNGHLEVVNNFTVQGSIVFSGTADGSFIPAVDNNYTLGNTTNQWLLYSTTATVTTALNVKDITANGITTTAALYPAANGTAFGNTTKRFAATITTLSASGNAAVSGVTSLAKLTANGGINLSGNNQLTFGGAGGVNINSSLAFDTDVLYIDATNNRVGIKNAAPSSQGALSVGGDAVFYGNTTGVKLYDGAVTSASNAHIRVVGSGTDVGKLVLSMTDLSNTTVSNGGLSFYSVNSTASYQTLEVNKNRFYYNGGNVATKTTFGIYNSTGTRVGP
jgi:hypothetical protein